MSALTKAVKTTELCSGIIRRVNSLMTEATKQPLPARFLRIMECSTKLFLHIHFHVGIKQEKKELNQDKNDRNENLYWECSCELHVLKDEVECDYQSDATAAQEDPAQLY